MAQPSRARRNNTSPSGQASAPPENGRNNESSAGSEELEDKRHYSLRIERDSTCRPLISFRSVDACDRTVRRDCSFIVKKMLRIEKKARIVRGLRPCGVFPTQAFQMKPNFVNAILFALWPTRRGADARACTKQDDRLMGERNRYSHT